MDQVIWRCMCIFFSHIYCVSPLWTQKGFEVELNQCRYKLLEGKGLSLFFPIVSSTTDYMQYSPSKISVENNERIYEEGKEKRKDNAIKGDKGISTIVLRSSPWPGSHPILLFTPFPVPLPSLRCFFSLLGMKSSETQFILPSYVRSLPACNSTAGICLCLALNCPHKDSCSTISPTKFYCSPRVKTMPYLFCTPPLFTSTQISPQTQKYLANTCWMAKSFQYFYHRSIAFFHLTLQVQKYIGKSYISKHALPSNRFIFSKTCNHWTKRQWLHQQEKKKRCKHTKKDLLCNHPTTASSLQL